MMKLAEALILRADYQKRIEQLKQRLVKNAKIQEGDAPSEDPAVLLREIEDISASLLDLIQRINRTNSQTMLTESQSLSDALAVRDILQIKQDACRLLAQAATITQDRFTKSEVRFKSTIPVADIQKKADDLAKEHRELDIKIQEHNWQIDLL